MTLLITILVIITIILLFCGKEKIEKTENYKAIEGKPVYMYSRVGIKGDPKSAYYADFGSPLLATQIYNDAHKYLYDYDGIFGWWPFWYNKTTPLPFNNPTRFYGFNYYYPAIHDYYYPRIRFY